MNGELGEIYNAITEVKVELGKISTKQTANHNDNTGDIKVLFKKLEKLDNLPCEVHVERMKNFKWVLGGLCLTMLAMAGWMLTIQYN